MRSRDPYSFTTVVLPERDLAEVVLEVAAPLLDELGPAATVDEAREAIALAVEFWNASVLASKRWERRRSSKALNALKQRLRERRTQRGGAAIFTVLADRWREHWLDPRLVASWTYDADDAGGRRFVCEMALPAWVRAGVPPPAEDRIAIAGRFLDEVRISMGGNASLCFPVERHRGSVAADGTVTIHAMMPAALQLLAEGSLHRVGGPAVNVAVGGRDQGAMVLTEVRVSGADLRHDTAILVFRPASTRTPP